MPAWPDNKKFAFSVVDDTDCTTLANGPVVYDFLRSCGLRTTKTVWMFDGEVRDDNRRIIGTTCQDLSYLEWVLKLQKEGFEIGIHNTSWSRSRRERVVQALDRFKEHFGDYPKVLAQHNDTVPNESVYWGENRIGGISRAVYKALIRVKGERRNIYQGEMEDSPFFWGDVCKARIKYVRNFVYPESNTLRACPVMPYHDADRPYVNYWFASTEGPDVRSFCACLTKERLQRLEEEHGACIMYTHFGTNFVVNRELDAEFRRVIERLVQRSGWFVTASELLDHLLAQQGHKVVSARQRALLETKWLWHKVRVGTT